MFINLGCNDARPATNATARAISPQNGICDSASAKLLHSELDLLEEEMTKANSKTVSHSSNELVNTDKLAASQSQDNDVMTRDGTVTSDDHVVTLSEDWVLLECCYGVPLFGAHLNHDICQKILRNSLCKKER